jgi:hypothetical protein
VTDEEMEELWLVTPDGTTVEIRPELLNCEIRYRWL